MQPDLIGKRLGNYQIEHSLGRGGMAVVYKAMDTTLKRPVAIKVIAPDLNDEARYQERFEKEAQSIAVLDHPHIVPVYYFGKSRSLYYLAMKFIEGETLETLMKRYAAQGEFLPTNDIVRMMEGVAGALDYAHSKGVIHRDIKPSNIMIDSSGHAYVTDFGLALNVHQGTMGEIFGTPHYIAPEQATSSSSAVAQSDLYSLGVILYELFSGAVPFDDPSPMAIALHHITQEPISPRVLNPQLAPAVEQVILKALEKQPEARYQTGAKLVSALRTALRASAKREQAAPALPPLPAGMKAPAPRRVSNRPIATEVQTLLEQRAKAAPVVPRTPSTPLPAAPKQAANKPKEKPVKTRALRWRRVLLLLLIVVIGGAGILLSQTPMPLSLPPVMGFTAPTPPPDGWQPVRFVYNDDSLWWISHTSETFLTARIRFARPDGSDAFRGRRWASIYRLLEGKGCVRVTAFDAEERMPRPAECAYTNADIISTSEEAFWRGAGDFYVYWDDQIVAVCQNSAGECSAALPPQ